MSLKTIGVVVVALLLIAGGAVAFVLSGDMPDRTADDGGDGNNGASVCTQEALMCPDGTFVGRSGSECRFEACTAANSYVGTLQQQDGVFRLIMPAPAEAAEITYVMPLEIRASNALRDLVGRRVRVFGAIREANIFIVGRLEELPENQSDPETAQVAVGETFFINGVNVTLNQVVQDSRCPEDEECMEAGGITVSVTLRSDTDMETRNIASDEVPASFDSFRISIIEVAPPRFSGGDPAPEDYVLTFRVTRI